MMYFVRSATFSLDRWSYAAVSALMIQVAAGFVNASAVPVDFQSRRDALLAQTINDYSSERIDRKCALAADSRPSCGVLSELAVALAAFYRAKDENEKTLADSATRKAISRLAAILDAEQSKTSDEARFERYAHQFLGPVALLIRIHLLFGPNGILAERVSVTNDRNMLILIWRYAKRHCQIADTEPLDTWQLKRFESENHHITRSANCLIIGSILSSQTCGPCQYEDGSDVDTQRRAWTQYLEAYIRQRAMYGGLQEYFSPTYYKYSLMNFYNISEFALDPRLRTLARFFLDIWFADWSEEQVHGFFGGSKTRVYMNTVGRVHIGAELGWLYFGVGEPQEHSDSAALMVATTSSYRPPDAVNAIATHNLAFGSYDVLSRRPGLAGAQTRELDASAGGILRYTYVTPSFVMGTAMTGKLPLHQWQTGSMQNRWNGLIITDKQNGAYIFARPESRDPRGPRSNVYNGEWGVQSQGLQIVQKLGSPLSRNAGPMVVWVASSLAVERERDWAFIDAGAYIAFRPAFGGFGRVQQPGKFILENDLAPVIIQAADRAEYRNFADFKAAILAAPLSIDLDAIRFRGLGKAGTITFFYKSNRLPEINGTSIDLAPPYGFLSPFIKSEWGKGVVTVRYGDQHDVYDFRH